MDKLFRSNRHPLSKVIKVRRCLFEMEELGKNDMFFSDAVREFWGAEESGDVGRLNEMVNRLVSLYDDWYKDRGSISLRTEIALCAYEEDEL